MLVLAWRRSWSRFDLNIYSFALLSHHSHLIVGHCQTDSLTLGCTNASSVSMHLACARPTKHCNVCYKMWLQCGSGTSYRYLFTVFRHYLRQGRISQRKSPENCRFLILWEHQVWSSQSKTILYRDTRKPWSIIKDIQPKLDHEVNYMRFPLVF